MGDASSYKIPDGRNLRFNPIWSTDCFYSILGSADGTYPWVTTQVGAGSVGAGTSMATADHPGVISVITASANSGIMFQTFTDSFVIGGGECMEVIIKPHLLSGTTTRIGFHDATTVTAPVDGVYFEVGATGAYVGKTSNNSTRSTTPTIATVTADNWYRLSLCVMPDGSGVDFYITDDTGVLLGTQQLTTNMPTTSRFMRSCVITTNSLGNSGIVILYLDWMAMWYEGRSLIRG